MAPMFYNLVNYCLSQRGSGDREHTSPGGAISIIVSEKLGMEYERSVPLIEMSIGAKTFIVRTRSQKNMAAMTVFLVSDTQMLLKGCSIAQQHPQLFVGVMFSVFLFHASFWGEALLSLIKSKSSV